MTHYQIGIAECQSQQRLDRLWYILSSQHFRRSLAHYGYACTSLVCQHTRPLRRIVHAPQPVGDLIADFQCATQQQLLCFGAKPQDHAHIVDQRQFIGGQ